MLHVVPPTAKPDDSTATAKQLKVDLLKLLLKVLLLYREHIITPEALQPAKQPLLLMMDLLIETLEADRSKRNPAELARAMAECHDATMPLLKPNVREHNWVRLTRVFDFYGNEAFLTAFLLDDSYTVMRNAILINFQILLKRYELGGVDSYLRTQLSGQTQAVILDLPKTRDLGNPKPETRNPGPRPCPAPDPDPDPDPGPRPCP